MSLFRQHFAAEQTTIISNQAVTTGTTSSMVLFTTGAPAFCIDIRTTPDNNTDNLIAEVYASADGTDIVVPSPTFDLTFDSSAAAAARIWCMSVTCEQCDYAKGFKLLLKASSTNTSFDGTYVYARAVYLSDRE